MERETLAAGPADRTRAVIPWWPLLFVGLVAWQGWMTLTLFDRDDPWRRLTDDAPILSGRHPLHLYHGYLGARAFLSNGTLSCYDPAFQIGYPKTPVFDSGSRPAEFFLTLTGGEYRPAAYKVGLALACLLVPCLLGLACRGAGLGPAATLLACGAGLLVWWGAAGRKSLEAGDIELLLAALAVLAHAGLLIRFDAAPGLAAWLGLLATATLGWFSHPLVFPLLLPLLLVYYLSIGARHLHLTWHLGLLTSQAGAILINLFWLSDWVTYWWLRSPLPRPADLLRTRTLRTLWDSPIWGSAADRELAVLLLGSALVGVCVFNQSRRRVAARLLGLGACGLLVLAVLGIAWEPLGRIGTSGLLVPALWFAALPAAHAWTQAARMMVRGTGSRWRGGLVVCGLVGAAVALRFDTVTAFAQRCRGTEPLLIGLGPERQALVETLAAHTDPTARVLWEERPADRETPRWTALLPVLTGRSFLGGLDPEQTIEHVKCGLIDGELARQPLSKASDAYLEGYCRRYNVGWAVCWSKAAIERFRAWPGASEVAAVRDGGDGVLFSIRRTGHGIALKGQAYLVHADSNHITLADVVPEDGSVVLSLHYQAGLRASPSRVHIDRYPDVNDPVPFVRLRVDSPVARVTITWDERP